MSYPVSKGERRMSFFENFTEDKLEEAAIEILQELGYDYVFGPNISCDGERPERKDLSYRNFRIAICHRKQ